MSAISSSRITIFFSIMITCMLSGNYGFSEEAYHKSTEGGDLVKDKLYPKKKKLELTLPDVGMVLNESYVKTYLIGGGGDYFINEEWGLGLDVSIGLNSDKQERTCIENFYNDPLGQLPDPCGSSSELTGTIASMGPAYVPIRQIKTIVLGNAIWNPVYGKALLFMSGTIYFDLFVEMGGGVVMSDYYPKTTTLKNGNVSRGTYASKTARDPTIGALGNETSAYGIAGRPTPLSQTNVALNVGVGQKFHFKKKFDLRIYIRNMTLVGTADGFENIFVLFGGAGVRF